MRLRNTARSLTISESPARRSAAGATALPRVPPRSRQARHRSGLLEHAPVSAVAAFRRRSSADQPEFDAPGARIRPRSASVAGHAAVTSTLRAVPAVARPAAPGGRRQAATYRQRAGRRRRTWRYRAPAAIPPPGLIGRMSAIDREAIIRTSPAATAAL